MPAETEPYNRQTGRELSRIVYTQDQIQKRVGEMADEILLNGQRVAPARLQAAGFDFRFPDLDTALGDIL